MEANAFSLRLEVVSEEIGAPRRISDMSSMRPVETPVRHVSTGRLLDVRLAPAVALDHGGLEGRAAQLGDPELDLSAGRG